MTTEARAEGVRAAESGGGRVPVILSGDIGGTKTYLGLFTFKDARPVPLREASFTNSQFHGPLEVIEEFLKKDSARKIDSAAFGVAGPVAEGRPKMTTLPWVVDAAEIAGRLGIKKAGVINDLVATAWGVDLLTEEDILTLQEGNPEPGNAALIAAGTGLGEALLYWDGSSLIPVASEAGHADFAPRDPLEIELLRYLIGLYGHVSYERVLSGRGLEDIYNFFKDKSGGDEPGYLKKRFKEEGVAPVVSDEAMNGADNNCKRALSLFLSIYGAEAGNLALRSLSAGGLYVGGGIAVRILEAFKEKDVFIGSFLKKGRLKNFLSRVPVRVILNDKTGLLGAARYAARL